VEAKQNSLTAVNHENKRNAADSSETVVHPWYRGTWQNGCSLWNVLLRSYIRPKTSNYTVLTFHTYSAGSIRHAWFGKDMSIWQHRYTISEIGRWS